MSKLRFDGSDYRVTPLLRLAGFIMLGCNVAILPILIYLGVQSFFMPLLPIQLVAHWILPTVIGIYVVLNVATRIMGRRQEKLPDEPMPGQRRFSRAA